MRGDMRYLFILFILFGINIFAQSQEVVEVEATGDGSIIANDLAKARDDAIQDALRNAVEQTVGMLLSSETITQNFMTIDDKIYSRSTGYVQKYDIVSEGKENDFVYRVKIKAIVKKGMITDDLAAIGLLMRRKNLPRVMVIIQENNLSTKSGNVIDMNLNTSETKLMELMIEKGFTFVDMEAVKSKMDRTVALAAISGDVDAAKNLGLMFNAEIIILGKAVSSVATGMKDKLGGMISCQADVTLRVIDVSNGEIIAVTSQHGAAVHIDEITGGNEAIKKATELAAKDIIEKILKRWQSDVTGTQKIEMVVYGFKTFNDVYTFKNEFSSYLRGVKGVYSHGFQGGNAVFTVEFEGNSESLLLELTRKGLPSFNVEVKEQSQAKVTIKVSPKGG
uniref:Flagellar assembly protein T N-terminal domain-containing protein n=1 Tax=candidate division WOR-3 bacterium TaxID=2052148 RepID=A0A7C4UAQ9_UNCW3